MESDRDRSLGRREESEMQLVIEESTMNDDDDHENRSDILNRDMNSINRNPAAVGCQAQRQSDETLVRRKDRSGVTKTKANARGPNFHVAKRVLQAQSTKRTRECNVRRRSKRVRNLVPDMYAKYLVHDPATYAKWCRLYKSNFSEILDDTCLTENCMPTMERPALISLIPSIPLVLSTVKNGAT